MTKRFKLPIGSVTYQVHINAEMMEEARKLSGEQGRVGVCIPAIQAIIVDPGLPKDGMLQVIRHEVIHAILGEYSLSEAIKPEHLEVLIDVFSHELPRALARIERSLK